VIRVYAEAGNVIETHEHTGVIIFRQIPEAAKLYVEQSYVPPNNTHLLTQMANCCDYPLADGNGSRRGVFYFSDYAAV
jgi:hypothetical protein